eukprot:242934-Pyramimonas_sp.AAC.1
MMTKNRNRFGALGARLACTAAHRCHAKAESILLHPSLSQRLCCVYLSCLLGHVVVVVEAGIRPGIDLRDEVWHGVGPGAVALLGGVPAEVAD